MGTKPNPIIALSIQANLVVMENEQRKDLNSSGELKREEGVLDC